MAGKDAASTRSLDRAEALELLGLHRDLLAEADLAGGTTDERHTVRVERLVNRRRARLSASDGDAALLRLLGNSLVVTLAETLDDRRLHRELDQVKRDKPDDVPTTDDTDPSAGDGMDASEAPVGLRGNCYERQVNAQ